MFGGIGLLPAAASAADDDVTKIPAEPHHAVFYPNSMVCGVSSRSARQNWLVDCERETRAVGFVASKFAHHSMSYALVIHPDRSATIAQKTSSGSASVDLSGKQLIEKAFPSFEPLWGVSVDRVFLIELEYPRLQISPITSEKPKNGTPIKATLYPPELLNKNYVRDRRSGLPATSTVFFQMTRRTF
jgi:hypothetical protein